MSREDIERSGGATGDEPRGGARGSGFSRRRLMATGAATWASVGLAGCSDDDGSGEEDPSPTATDTGEYTVTTHTTTTEALPTTGSTTTDSSTPESSPTETPTPTEGGGATTTSCSQGDLFIPGSDVGFLVGVYESDTGRLLADDAVEGVTVRFPEADLEPVDLSWDGPHSEYVSEKWGGKLSTEGVAPGSYRYTVGLAEGESGDEEELLTDWFAVAEPRR